MIFNTNRTASLNDDIVVDVNESYFGAGSLDYMQENAQDELALFEAAIKSDIDECLIGESAEELAALNEGFVQTAANKIKEMMRKFIEWLKSVTRSIIAKMSQLVLRDNDKFVKQARKMLVKMSNKSDFKYSGKALNISALNTDHKEEADARDKFNALYEKAKEAKEQSTIDSIKSELESAKEAFKNADMRKDFDEKVLIDVTDKDLNFVESHLKVLEDYGKKDLGKIKKEIKEAESKAKKIAKSAEDKSKKFSGEDAVEKARLALMADCAAAYRSAAQDFTKDALYILKKTISVARAVVTKGMGATPKHEGVEYTEELIQAMIEASEFELDEALEEMSEAKECKSEEDDIEDEE